MRKRGKLLQRLMSGASDANIRFAELRELLLRLGFDERVRGDHHIFTRSGMEEILNLQPRKAMAKPYQVKQVRRVVLKYNLGGKDAEQV
ncbi:MAG: type II toxin-antitoxin system HicA family toxin [Planctomycetota bacterium]